MGDIEYGKKKGKKENTLPSEPILQRDVLVGTCPTHGQVKVWVNEIPAYPGHRCPIAASTLTIGKVKFSETRCNSSLSLRLVRKSHNVSAA